MSIFVPVFLVDAAGQRVADNVNCSPCIDVVVVAGPHAVRAVALLDSGATGIYGDPVLLDTLAAPITRTDVVHAIGMSHATPVHAVTLWIDDLPDLQAEMQAVPCRSNGKPYDIVLGRSFLTMFDFGFDQRTQAWKLVLLGAQRATNQNRPAL